METAWLSENSHPGLCAFPRPSHPALAFAKPLTASGISTCLYDSRVGPRCTAKERDTETGLDYFGARYLSSAQGRWTSPDKPFADQHLYGPQSWNIYSYVGNNPLRFIDTDGRGKAGVFYKVITKITRKGRTYKKVTTIRISRDEAKRLFRKEGADVLGSKKGAKQIAGKGAIEDPIHRRGLGDRRPHFHDAERSGGHAFFEESAGLVIPGSTLGTDIFGDNLLGEVVDFFNPLSDAQGILDIWEDFTDQLPHPPLPTQLPQRANPNTFFPCLTPGCHLPSFPPINSSPPPPPRPVRACVTMPGVNGPETVCE